MFREMRRAKQALSEAECLELLKTEVRGVLAVLGDDGYPYAVPHNHFYDEEDGKLYFHSGKIGHKIDALRACGKASYAVIDGGSPDEDGWSLHFRSVIVFGRVEIVEDREKAIEISRRLCFKFTDDREYIEQEILRSGAGVLVFSLTPEHITGKRIHES